MAVSVRILDGDVRAVLRIAPGVLAMRVRDEWKKVGKSFRTAVANGFAAKHPDKARRAKFWVMDRMTQFRKGPGDPGMPQGEAELGIFATSPRLLAHQFGLTIKDPTGGAMAIPMGEAATKIMKRAKTDYVGKGGHYDPALFKSLRGISKKRQDHEFKIIRLRGKLYAAEMTPQGEIETIYARIVKSVKLKPTLGFYETWERLRGERDAAIERAVARAIKTLNTTPVTDFSGKKMQLTGTEG